MCKKLGPHLEAGTVDKAPDPISQGYLNSSSLYLDTHMFLMARVPTKVNLSVHRAAVFLLGR
jgi:hypothetical protein